MTVGIAMLVHTAMDRAEQVARHWTSAGCPVVIHVDQNVSVSDYETLHSALDPDPLVSFSERHRCEWGTWSIVKASQSASQLLLEQFPHVRHVFLASGSCLPLRPVGELLDYLAGRPRTDFIESATTSEVQWPMAGLDHERFTLRFPFSWKRQRRLFDKYVQLQRQLGLKRQVPAKIVPHMGSQWWCLSRQTLSAILQDPERAIYERFFRRVWIPDESYFQTLARLYSVNIESRSLTLSKFDFQGKPHIFYDDHLQLLQRSDCFVARKIWPKADRLYQVFPIRQEDASESPEPNPGKIDRIFAKAVDRRTNGRPGLYMQSRMPQAGREKGMTSGPYSVFLGFSDLFSDFESWLTKTTDARVHGHLFAPERAAFAENETITHGCLTDCASKRAYAPDTFLTSLLWNTRGERQCFQFGPTDRQQVGHFIARDPNAHVSVISGAWAVRLFRTNRNFERAMCDGQSGKIRNVFTQR